MVPKLPSKCYIKLVTLYFEFVLRPQNDSARQVQNSVRSSAQNVVPNSTNHLHTAEVVGKPCEHPGNDES